MLLHWKRPSSFVMASAWNGDTKAYASPPCFPHQSRLCKSPRGMDWLQVGAFARKSMFKFRRPPASCVVSPLRLIVSWLPLSPTDLLHAESRRHSQGLRLRQVFHAERSYRGYRGPAREVYHGCKPRGVQTQRSVDTRGIGSSPEGLSLFLAPPAVDAPLEGFSPAAVYYLLQA